MEQWPRSSKLHMFTFQRKKLTFHKYIYVNQQAISPPNMDYSVLEFHELIKLERKLLSQLERVQAETNMRIVIPQMDDFELECVSGYTHLVERERLIRKAVQEINSQNNQMDSEFFDWVEKTEFTNEHSYYTAAETQVTNMKHLVMNWLRLQISDIEIVYEALRRVPVNQIDTSAYCPQFLVRNMSEPSPSLIKIPR